MSALEAAQVLGKYAIVRELGRGGFATVYLAQDTVLRRNVALKILHPVLLADPTFVQRFEQEAHATAQLDHPHIATIFDLGQLDGRLYIAMRLLSGGTLAERIKQGGPLPFAEAARVIEQVAGALDHAHAASFIHRDVKPTNILFNARGEAVLTDFGMVKAVESSVIARTSMGNVIGTPAYIAPEVWESKEGGVATDVYALGCVLFEMLTGELLFKGSTPPAVMLAHFRPHEYPAQWPPGTPPQLSMVLEQALARDPNARYAAASDLTAALRSLSEQPTNVAAVPSQAKHEQARQVTQRRDTAPGDAQASTQPSAAIAERQESVKATADREWITSGMVADKHTTDDKAGTSVPAGKGDTAPVRNVLWSAGALAAGWAIAWVIGLWCGLFAERLVGQAIGDGVASLLGWVIGWMLAGLITGLTLRWTQRGVQRPRVWMLAAGWPFCLTIGLVLSVLMFEKGRNSDWQLDPIWSLAGLAAGAALAGAIGGAALRTLVIPWKGTLLGLAWSAGLFLGEIIQPNTAGSLGLWREVFYRLLGEGSFESAFYGSPGLGLANAALGGVIGAALGYGFVLWRRSRTATGDVGRQDDRDTTSHSQVAPKIAQATPALGRDTTATPTLRAVTALTIVTWTLSQVFYEYIGIVGETRSAYEVGSFLGGGIGGFCLGHISRLIVAEIRAKHILLIAAGWAAAGLVRLEVGISLSQSLGDPNALLAWVIGDAVQCLIGGIITALVLRRALPTLPSRVTYLLPIGWGTGSILGSLIGSATGGPYEPTPRALIFFAIDYAISGAIGGGVMFWAISQARRKAAPDG
jgi:serine/threonine protein kinase